MKVALTTLAIDEPAAWRIAPQFLNAWRVCSWIVSPTTLPVAGSNGPWPDTKTSPAALTARVAHDRRRRKTLLATTARWLPSPHRSQQRLAGITSETAPARGFAARATSR